VQDFGELSRAVDVVAVNWRQRAILLGECKWGGERVGRALPRELVETKTPRVLETLPDKGAGWTVHHAFFARAGFTEAVQAEADGRQVTLVDLKRLDTDLREGGSG
jgi:predicted N-acetyltransferase YhbS